MKSKRGVTLVVVVLTVLIMVIILGTITYTSKSRYKLNQYYKMCADIELLDEKIALYYLEHEDEKNEDTYGLPIFDEQASQDLANIAITQGDVNYNPNNIGELYKIDLSKLENLSLNNTSDFYVDRQSHTVYCSRGIEMDGKIYYTVPIDYQVTNTNEIGDSLYCTVKFTDGVDGESVLGTQNVRTGQTAKIPKAPKKEGYEFVGWFYTPEGGSKTEFDFNSEVSQNYELNAKWTGQAVMMARSETYAFWQESIRTNLKNITFTKDASLIPQGLTEDNIFDLRADKINGGEVTGYLKDSENLIIYSPYRIYANASNYFNTFPALISIEFNNFDTSKVTNMAYMFQSCSSLTNFNLSGFDTSNVTSMAQMFFACSGLTNLDLSNFNTSNVTNMNHMFAACGQLDPIWVGPNWTTANADITDMFNNCKTDHVTLKE